MIPAAIATRVANGRPHVDQLLELLTNRLKADLAGVNLVSVIGRPKSDASVFQKLQTGKYASIDEINDLAALTVVVLHRREVGIALEAVKNSGLQIVEEPISKLAPTDLRYHEPKLLLKAPIAVTDRNPELANLVAEVQFTTALQHALDMATHDFDYKGNSYSWSNFRLVAQLRGTLELVDGLIDDIGTVILPNHERDTVPEDFILASRTLEVLKSHFGDDTLPNDQRRLADTVGAWIKAVDIDPECLDELLGHHPDLTASLSLDPASAVLGALLRHDASKLVAGFPQRLAISVELASLVAEAQDVPEGRRVILT